MWHVPTAMTRNMELNDLRKIICLKKPEVYVKNKKKTVSNVIGKLVEHDIHCLPCSNTKDVADLSLYSNYDIILTSV